MDGVAAMRGPLFTETAEVALLGEDPRAMAEMMVSARKVLMQTIDRLLTAADRGAMLAVLEESLSDCLGALRVANLEVKLEDRRMAARGRSLRSRPELLATLQGRGVEDEVVERVRLGLLAADDESVLLGLLPGGLDVHAELATEDAKGRLLLMAIAKWAYSSDPQPTVWQALTFEFLDTAGRAYGLASSIISKQLEDVA